MDMMEKVERLREKADVTREEAMAALDRAKGFIRSELSQRLDIRRCPELQFEIDTAEENARHIDELIAEIHKNDKKSEEN